MKAFLLICTSIKSSILSSLSIVWFDRHELIMNDQAVPLKHEQPEYTEEEGCGCVCVWQGISQETGLQYINSSSTLTIFFKVAVPAVVAMSKI